MKIMQLVFTQSKSGPDRKFMKRFTVRIQSRKIVVVWISPIQV